MCGYVQLDSYSVKQAGSWGDQRNQDGNWSERSGKLCGQTRNEESQEKKCYQRGKFWRKAQRLYMQEPHQEVKSAEQQRQKARDTGN